MRRRTTASALAAVVVCAGLTPGQPPAKKAPADPTDALIQKALANDPDVQVARAKLALAEAEVAKARQAAVTRVITLRDTVEQQRQAVVRMSEVLTLKEHALKVGGGSREELITVQEKVATARSALERAETELRLLIGDGPKAAAPRASSDDIAAEIAGLLAQSYPNAAAEALALLNQRVGAKGTTGPIPDRIRAALDKKVRLGGKGDRISLDAAMEVFKKEAGLDVPIRPTPSPMPRIVLDGEELPIGAWFQMFQDHGGHAGITFYVRDYGLLVANRQTAPPDAMTLTEFWRTRPVLAQQGPGPKLPAGKRHELAHDKLPDTIKAKVGDTIVIPLPIKVADLESAKSRALNGQIDTDVEETAGGGVAVVIRARAGRAGKDRVSWDVTDATGRRFTERGREVEFE